VLVGVAVAAVAFAIAEGGDDADRRTATAPRAERKPRPSPRPGPSLPGPRPHVERGYPAGTKRRFVSICEERTPLDADACECVYDRLHDEYSYEEFRRLIEKIDPARGRVPPELLEHVVPCRLP
jgi:hypothetical protein